jgi:L-ascorbate metabolism protein UlaG (beta-lactamase superfamily)
MQITYHGHSCFKLKGELGSVVTDPFDDKVVGVPLARLSAEIVTVSHQHPDHNADSKVKGTAKRDNPFLIDQAGEYEVGGISVFGVKTFHDQVGGAEKGHNMVFKILLDNVSICHLGDLAHLLDEKQLDAIGMVDVLLVPVGGPYSLMDEMAIKVINAISPSIVIPMHYRAEDYPSDSRLRGLEPFLQAYGMSPEPLDKLIVDKDRLPEETQLVVLQRS